MTGNSGNGPSPLAIGLYCPAWPPERFANGIITYVDTIAEKMQQLGHRPYILAGRVDREARDEESEVPVIDLQPHSRPNGLVRVAEAVAYRLRSPSTLDGIRRVIRGLRAVARGGGDLPRLDLIEVEETYGMAGSVALASPIPLVARMHGPWFLIGEHMGADPEGLAFARRVQLEGEGLRRVAGVTAPSADVLRRTASRYGLDPSGAEVIPNPVRPVPPDRRWRIEGCEADHVLFVGRFDGCKGGDTVVDAFALVLRDRPGARLTFVGPDAGLNRDGRRWTLPEYVEHRLPGALEDGRVQWLGRRPPSELSALRLRAAVTVVASRYETFALTATEAMAAGCPLVATRAGGAGELFEHGEHGLYAEPGDPSGLASAISAMLADPGRAGEMGRRAAEHCERRYAPEVVAERTVRFYRQVLAARGNHFGALEETRP